MCKEVETVQMKKILYLSLFIISNLCLTASASLIFGDNFTKSSPLKKLFKQSQKTYELFIGQFTRQLIKGGINTPEDRKMFMDAVRDVEGGTKKAEEFLNKDKDLSSENPQVQLGKLAFLYTAMNRADLATATSITRICSVDNLLNDKKNPNVCNTYAPYLTKLIELRISVITSRIMYSGGIIGIPKNWVAHVQHMVKDLEAAEMLSDSLKHLLFLLRSVAQNNDEVDTAIRMNHLSPKTLTQAEMLRNNLPTEHYTNLTAPVTAPIPQRITIDARNLTSQQSRQSSLDTLIAQVMPKMMMF